MSHRSKETAAVQLFPFLAVLVCTMGALIFLLLITSRQIRVRAIALAIYNQAMRDLASTQTPAPPAEPAPAVHTEVELPKTIVLPPEIETKKKNEPDAQYVLALAQRERDLEELAARWKDQANQLTKDRDRRRAELVRQRKRVAAESVQADSLQSDVDNLVEELGLLTDDAAAASMTATEQAEQRSLQRQIAEMKRKLRAAQNASASAENDQFQVVPFDPRTGTTRRPIFIECTESGIRFLPEDISITAADLSGFTPRTNPIAAATGALINYWTDRNSQQRNPKAEPEPYVLLLVRPNGVVAYYVAMRMLEPIRTQHGYELIEDSTALHLPPVDPGARAACLNAVQRLMKEREYVARSTFVNGSDVGGGRGGYAAGGHPGNGSGQSGTGHGGRRSSGSDRNVGTSSANRGGFNLDDLTGGDNNVGSRSWERVENFGERPPRHRTGSDGTAIGDSRGSSSEDAGGEATDGESIDGVASENAVFGSPDGGLVPRGTTARRTARTARGGGLSADQGGHGGSTLSGGSTRVGRPGGAAKSEPGTAGDAIDSEELAQAEPGTESQFGSSGNRSNLGSEAMEGNGAFGQAAQGRQQRPGNGTAGDRWQSNPGKKNAAGDVFAGEEDHAPGMPIGKRPGKKAAEGNSRYGSQSDEAFADSIGAEEDSLYDATGSRSGEMSGGRSNRSRWSGENGGLQGHLNGGHRESGGSRSHNPRHGKSGDDRQIEPEMLAGRHWGFSEPGATIGFEREVRVEVLDQKLVIAEKYEIPVGQGETKQETFERFIDSLDRYSREWGRPPQGFFWTPRLKFVVKPQANSHYEQVNSLAKRAGLATSHEFAKETETIEYGRDTSAPRPAVKPISKSSSGGVR